MKNRLPTWRRSTAKWMPQSGSKWRPLQEAKLQVTNLNRAGTSTLSLRGNLRISKSSPGLRNYLPSLCSLGQRVKKLRLLREALTSFVKENTSISLWLVALTHWPLRKQIAVYLYIYIFVSGCQTDRINAFTEFLLMISFKICNSLLCCGLFMRQDCDKNSFNEVGFFPPCTLQKRLPD